MTEFCVVSYAVIGVLFALMLAFEADPPFEDWREWEEWLLLLFVASLWPLMLWLMFEKDEEQG